MIVIVQSIVTGDTFKALLDWRLFSSSP